MEQGLSFGNYVRQRRREMDLTQEELARRVGCAAITLRKIEADDLRASVQIAERLTMALSIPLEARAEFVRKARAVRPEPADSAQVTPAPTMDEIGREDLTGRAIRGYALAERIGVGGMGTVYRAVQPNVDREVAVKIILPVFANHPDFIRRFEAEAQLVARLEHPHIVPLYDYWREPGVAYLVMRLLRGGNVENLMGQGLLPVEITTHMLEQICSALHAAHRIGVIHRDLKPANVLLDDDTNAYLADFGIAKNLGNPDFENQTRADAMIGSPQYMSPEQIHSLSVRPQTDIYCLGVMLYEMLTGSPPFTGPTPFEMIQQHINTPMPPLSARRAGLPSALDAVITRATAKDPDERYADALSLFQDFHQAIGRLSSESISVIAYEEEDTSSEVINPFKGLRAFSEADEENFFGRETMIQQLLARLGESGELSRFLAVLGPSGSGKSSVVRAGLIPALRRGGLPGSENWFVVDMLPGKHPFEELEASLLRVAVNPPQSLLAQLKDGNRGLLRAIRRILPKEAAVELVLVIDQFEEIFTLVEDESERAMLLESIATAVMDEQSRLRVLITLRADFTDKPLHYVDFGEMMNRRFEFILPLNADEVERAVAGPAQRVGLRLEKGLISTIIRDSGNQPGALPLLQYALSELFEKREGRTLTNKAYQQIGGVHGALGRSAETIFSSLDEASQAAARQMFLRLVTLGEGSADTRRRVLRAELEDLTTDGGQRMTPASTPVARATSGTAHSTSLLKSPFSAVIEAFGKARLLSFDRDPITRGATSEVAHEALLREWTRLREWLTESRADVRLQRQLAAAAQEWQNANRDPSFLLTGVRLEQFEGWAENTTIALTQDERSFLDASIDERDRRESEERARQQREFKNLQKLAETEKRRAEEQTRSAALLRKRAYYLTGAFVIALLMSVIATLFARQAQTASQTATSRELASASVANLEVDPEVSILLALQALSVSETDEAENALHRAVMASRVTRRIETNGEMYSMTYSPDGTRFVTAGKDGVAYIWDVANSNKLLELRGHTKQINQVVFSPNGTRIATASDDLTARIWDAETGLELFVLKGHAARVSGLAFSPDVTQLATVSEDTTLRIWNVTNGSLILVGPERTNDRVRMTSVAFSPDGKWLATGSTESVIEFWETQKNEPVGVIFNPDLDPISTLAISPDGTIIASASGSVVRLWDVATGQNILTFTEHTNVVNRLEFSPDGSRIASAGLDRKIHVWDVKAGQIVITLAGHEGAVNAVTFGPDDSSLASVADDATLRVWNIGPAREVYAVDTIDPWPILSLSNDGRWIAEGVGTSVKVWDAQTFEELFSLPETKLVGGVSFSPDDKFIASAGDDGYIRIWDLESRNVVLVLTAHTPIASAVAYSPDGRLLASAGDENIVKIWDVGTGEMLFVLGGQPDTELTGNSVTFSPDSSMIATGGFGGDAFVWNTHTGELIRTFEGHTDAIWGVAFSQDGQKLVTSSRDSTVKVWDVRTGTLLLTLKGHTGTVTFAAFNPDGTRIATASRDGRVIVWDAVTGKLLLTFAGDGSAVGSAVFTPDGTRLLTASGESLRMYAINLSDLITLAQSRLTRSLTPEECEKYLHMEQCP